MSIYFKDRIKENVEKEMENDLNFDKNRPPIMPNGYILSKKEFNLFWIIFQASEYSNTKDFFEHWTFFLTDDVVEEIILEDDELKQMYDEPCDLDVEECLEEAKELHYIYGFCYLGSDLWIIKEQLEMITMQEQEVRRVNSLLLMRLCREIGDKEKLSKHQAQLCTLIINDALTQLKEV